MSCTEIHRKTKDLLKSGNIDGAQYAGVILTSGEHEQAYDPELHLYPEMISGYWPGGTPDGRRYVSFLLDPDNESASPNTLIEQSRTAILDARVGADARRRFESTFHTDMTRQAVRNLLGHNLIPTVDSQCAQHDLPFVSIVRQRIVKSSVYTPGEKIPYMLFPDILNPDEALNLIQQKVHSINAEEEL